MASPHVDANDLAFRPSDTLLPPATLLPEQTATDLAVARFAYREAYGGYPYVDAADRDELERRLDELHEFTDPNALCDAIAAALSRLPDAHLSAKLGRRRCGGKPAHLRVPSVGASAHPADRKAPWALQWRQRVALLSIKSFPAGDAPPWAGYDEAVDRLLTADAVIVDLRGNSGGDDTRGFQLARSLIGTEVAPGHAVVHQRQTMASTTVMLNWLGLELTGAAEREDIDSPHIPAFLVEQRRLQLRILRGEVEPWVHRKVARHPIPSPPAYDRPVFILADAACASSCESSLEALRSHPRARFVGERTAGFIHFGNGGLVVLPHSQIRLYVPTKYNEYSDGTFYDKVGFTPDVAVPPGRDAFDVALELASEAGSE